MQRRLIQQLCFRNAKELETNRSRLSPRPTSAARKVTKSVGYGTVLLLCRSRKVFLRKQGITRKTSSYITTFFGLRKHLSHKLRDGGQHRTTLKNPSHSGLLKSVPSNSVLLESFPHHSVPLKSFPTHSVPLKFVPSHLGLSWPISPHFSLSHPIPSN